MTPRRSWSLGICAALLAAVLLAAPLGAGEIALTVVNIETPQGVKIWEPPTIVAQKGDTVSLKLINRLAEEHGFEIAAFGVKVVVDGNKSKDITFKADKAGIFPIKCQLHPPHVAGQFIVLE